MGKDDIKKMIDRALSGDFPKLSNMVEKSLTFPVGIKMICPRCNNEFHNSSPPISMRCQSQGLELFPIQSEDIFGYNIYEIDGDKFNDLDRHFKRLDFAKHICYRCRQEISNFPIRKTLTNKCNRCYLECSGGNYSILPDGSKVILCAYCARDLFSIQKNHHDVGISLIRDGEKDLARANSYDPYSDYIKTNLSQTRDLFLKLNLTPMPYNISTDPVGKFLSQSPAKPKKGAEVSIKKPKPLIKTRPKRNVFHFALLFFLFIFATVIGWFLLSLF